MSAICDAYLLRILAENLRRAKSGSNFGTAVSNLVSMIAIILAPMQLKLGVQNFHNPSEGYFSPTKVISEECQFRPGSILPQYVVDLDDGSPTIEPTFVSDGHSRRRTPVNSENIRKATVS